LLSIVGGALFVLLSTLAMFVYAGGSYQDPAASGYHFFQNFLSDLGLAVAYSGESNLASRILFTASLTAAGGALASYFAAALKLLTGRGLWLWLAAFGSGAGLVSAAAFIGIGLTPADLFLERHINLVLLAFVAFLAAALPYVPVMLRRRAYPRRYAGVFILFTALLGAYVWLILNGPPFETDRGRLIQIVGQKVIVYAAVLSVSLQAYGGWKMARRAADPAAPGSPS
jgi:hypothetical protein